MKISDEIQTEKGVATYLGDIGDFSVFLHLSPTPIFDQITSINSFEPVIDILFSNKKHKSSFLGFLPLDTIVERAVDNGFNGDLINLSRDDCSDIDELAWSTLSSKYRLVPTKFVLPK